MANATKYVARPGCGISNAEAQIVGQALEDMDAKKIRRTPENFLEIAKDKKSKLHEFFDWNDKSAAMKARLDHARHLIGGVQIIDFKIKQQVKAYHSIVSYNPTNKKQSVQRSYEPRDVVMKTPDKLDQVSRDLYSRILPIVREADALELTNADPAWRAIVACVLSNIPKAVPKERK